MRWPLIFLFLFSLNGVVLPSETRSQNKGDWQEQFDILKCYLHFYEQERNDIDVAYWKLVNDEGLFDFIGRFLGSFVSGPIRAIGNYFSDKDNQDNAVVWGVSLIGGLAGSVYLGKLIKMAAITNSAKFRKFVSKEDNITYEHHFKKSIDIYCAIYFYVLENGISPNLLDRLRHTLSSSIQQDVLWRIATNIRARNENQDNKG